MKTKNSSDPYTLLEQVIPPVVQDLRQHSRYVGGMEDWSRLSPAFLRFLVEDVAISIWSDHLLFLTAVLLQFGYTPQTVEHVVRILYEGLTALARTFAVVTPDDWDPELYLRMSYEYPALSPDLQAIGTKFWRLYSIATHHAQRQVAMLPSIEERIYTRYILPGVNPDVVSQLTASYHHR